MKFIKIKYSEVQCDKNLSPEHWISKNIASTHSGNVTLGDLFYISKKTSNSLGDKHFIFDTANSYLGLINILKGDGKERVSNKKILHEGCVIISRLRPYLKQVSYIPKGFMKKLEVDSIFSSTEYYPLIPRDSNLDAAFLVPFLLSDNVQDILSKAATGGHHPRFNEDLLMSLKIPDYFIDNSSFISSRIIDVINRNLDSQLLLASTLASHN